MAGQFAFQDVNPNTDYLGDELKQVDMGLSLEIFWYVPVPGSAMVCKSTKTMFTCITNVDDVWSSEGDEVHAHPTVS
jgi:hypothetical protein